MIKKVPIQWFVERFICDTCLSTHNRSYYLIKIGEEMRPRGDAAILECVRCRTKTEVFGYLEPKWEELAVSDHIAPNRTYGPPPSPENTPDWPAHLPYVTGGKSGPAVEPPKPSDISNPIPSYIVPPWVPTSPEPQETPPRMPQDRSEQGGLGGMVGEGIKTETWTKERDLFAFFEENYLLHEKSMSTSFFLGYLALRDGILEARKGSKS